MPSLQEVLGYLTISKAIQETTSGIPQPLPPGFFKSNTKALDGKGTYVRYTGERRTAKLAQRGSPARRADLKRVGESPFKCLHLYEEQSLDPFVLRYLRSANAWEHDAGYEEIKRQVREFAMKFYNTRVASVLQVLRNGVLYWDIDGNLLPSSSTAVHTHSFQMNANNQNQLNSIITASWATTTTDIPLQLRNLKKRARRLTGYPIKFAIYGENIPSYFSQNEYVIDYLARNPKMQTQYLETAEIPDGLFGLTWIPAYEAFYEDSAGTNQDIWGGDVVVFTPEISEEWWDIAEGDFPVPTDIGRVYTDGAAANASLKQVWGAGGYGIVGYNPPTVTGFYFDNFLPLLKNADAIYSADVTP